MITAVATSGRGVELVVGVAGAGKTTAVDVTRRAFDAAGYRVVGTSTSGQAARTLGAEAGIDESRTIASLLWRLDADRHSWTTAPWSFATKPGMTDDPNMLRLLVATEAAGSKLVIIGDHRQLGAVGPGGSLEALVKRHSGGVHVLAENVRQTDPEERTVLAQLRAGSIERAVNWYAEHDRITTGRDREEALNQMIAAWATDVTDGKQTAMLAWRRANVAALNSRARFAMAEAGRLSGPELHVAGNIYQAGDRFVTLAPSAHGAARHLAARNRDRRTNRYRHPGRPHGRRRTHTLGPDQIGPDRLAHGYATTVHRSQGATFDTAHLYADGGGRELGYVGMSRARESAHVHAVADNVDQAVEDLSWEWSRERRQTWAIDTGTPETHADRHPLEIEVDKQTPGGLRAILGRARLKVEREAAAVVPSHGHDPALRHRVASLDRHIQLLDQKLEPQRIPSPGGPPPAKSNPQLPNTASDPASRTIRPGSFARVFGRPLK